MDLFDLGLSSSEEKRNGDYDADASDDEKD